jgi:predicted nucleic acid-binding protein
MITRLVTDTSVVLKWFRQEEILAEYALDILHAYLDGHLYIVVPSLLAYEVANVLRYKSKLTTAHVETAVQNLFDLGLEWSEPSVTVMRRAVTIARENDTSVYDATFAALAESQGATLVTADERLVTKLTSLSFVRFLGQSGNNATYLVPR